MATECICTVCTKRVYIYCLWPFLGINQYWSGLVYGVCGFMSGRPEGSTGSGSDFKESKKTGPRLKVSSDRLGEPGIQLCSDLYKQTKQSKYVYPLCTNGKQKVYCVWPVRTDKTIKGLHTNKNPKVFGLLSVLSAKTNKFLWFLSCMNRRKQGMWFMTV